MKPCRIAAVIVAVGLLCWPQEGRAQSGSSITGVVRDSSGAVLPGVTVETASPALIEKVRVTVTDDEGLYRFVDLRPGEYTVTFTLAGFNTFRRDGMALPANFTATVNAQMTVGAIEETITVTGEAPLVDTQSIRQQTQFQRDTLESLPGTGRIVNLTQVIPGAAVDARRYSVGGVNENVQTNWSVHGGPGGTPVVDGRPQGMGALTGGVMSYNQLTFQEIVIETSGIGTESEEGGVRINIVQRDGGNTFSGAFNYAYTGPSLESNNIGGELLARGLNPAVTGSLKRYLDIGGAYGGPIMRDRLWFFAAHRSGSTQQIQAGNFSNTRQGTLFYEPDLSRPAFTDEKSRDYSLRLTWQAAQNHKVTVSETIQPKCNCPYGLFLLTGGNLGAPEALASHHYNPQSYTSMSWTHPATNRLLFDVGSTIIVVNQNNKRDRPDNRDIQVIEQANATRYGSRGLNVFNTGSYIFIPRAEYQAQAAVSYVTGTHNFKSGVQYRYFDTGDTTRNRDPNQINQGITYQFRNGVPNQLTLWAVPFAWEDHGRDVALFAQDQWTRRRLTLNLGVRYNDVYRSHPRAVLAAGRFVPERILPAIEKTPYWRNLNPRVGIAYDLFGDAKTAVKGSLGRYNPALRTTGSPPPAHSMTPSTNRSWNDANRNYVPDCDLLNPVANGECGPWSNRTFGQVTGTDVRQAPDAVEGFNRQDFHWQSSVTVQHELRPGVGLNVGYYRTWYGGFLVTDNEAVTPADYDEFCMTVPTDRRLPNSGQQLCGLYDIKPVKFGLVDNLQTRASNYGDRSQVYNGVDATLNARFWGGGQFQGGLSVGRTVEDNCLVIDSPQDARPGFCKVVPPWSSGTQLKFLVVYPLPLDLQTSVIYQNFGGVPQDTDIVVTNAQIAPSLGRSLAGGRSNVTVPLVPPQTLFEPRLQQLDLRITRTFRVDEYRIRGNFDVYNIFNASNVLDLTRRYGPAWLNAIQVMGGRLIKVGVQLDF